MRNATSVAQGKSSSAGRTVSKTSDHKTKVVGVPSRRDGGEGTRALIHLESLNDLSSFLAYALGLVLCHPLCFCWIPVVLGGRSGFIVYFPLSRELTL